MMSTYMLTALLVLLPLTFIPQAESGKPHAHPDSYVKIDDSCVFTGLSCFDGWNNITEVLVGLAEPADCGKFLMLFTNIIYIFLKGDSVKITCQNVFGGP